MEVKDSQGAIATKTIEVQIKGNDTPAVVWVETVENGSTAPGDWNDGSNWETGIVPTANDDAIIITDQLIGQTPVYPVTVKAGEVAAAKSVTMNDFNDNTPATLRPELDIATGCHPDDRRRRVEPERRCDPQEFRDPQRRQHRLAVG